VVGLMFMVLLFCVQWFCSPFPIERSSEMEFGADLQFNITLKCVICLCWCPCSICSVEQLDNMVNVA
jgi:hypothetical protein